jgi:DNA-binding response OmpR family regulator
MRVLIVEDDSALGHFLGQGLKLDGYEVDLAADGEAALALTARMPPEVMVLDLGLPRMDGLEVLEEMGERFGATSVLVLTARAGMEERVRCLELGADDVVLKPFSFHELRARVRAIGRRRSRLEDTVLRFGDLEMDRAARRVTQAGREVELTATEFSLLESLLRRRGERVCSRTELLREVWRCPQGMGTNIVEVYINYLRKKLGRGLSRGLGRGLETMRESGQAVIRTVRGEGYLLSATGDAGRGIGRRWSAAESRLTGASTEGWLADV